MQESFKLKLREIINIPKMSFFEQESLSTDQIDFMHGPHIITKNEQKLFDLRPYTINPILGHLHPLLEAEKADFSKVDSLAKLEATLSDSEKIKSYFDRIYLDSGRLKSIITFIEEQGISCHGNLPILKIQGSFEQAEFLRHGLYIQQQNIQADHLMLFINLALDKDLLQSLMTRIIKAINVHN